MIGKFWAVGLVIIGLSSACAHSKIPRTDIDDTEENRQILEIVEEYHRALEALDANAVLALVSPRFYEDNGNLTREDDYDYNGLKEQLTTEFARTRALKLDVRVDAVKVDEKEAYAELYYRIRAQNEYPSGLKWETGSDRTRLMFERADGKWLIVAGL